MYITSNKCSRSCAMSKVCTNGTPSYFSTLSACGREKMASNTNDRHVTEDLYILNAVVTSFSGHEKTTISPSSKYIEVLCTTVDFFSTHVSSVKALDMVSCKKIKHWLCCFSNYMLIVHILIYISVAVKDQVFGNVDGKK